MIQTLTRNGFFLLLMLLCLFTQAQQRIQIKVINDKKEVIPFSTIKITNRADSLQIFQQTTDSTGMASFDLAKNVQYNIVISSISYETLEKGISISDQTQLQFTLTRSNQTLGGVVVRSSRPVMRQEEDKTIVDPENLIPSSTSSYEILEKTPGLFVDQDGNIYISSTTPATVFINGREMKMSTADIATMLKSLPPNAISRIEILRSPSAKYDASSSGGIVNVVLRKGIKLGMTGSVTAGWQQGEYGNEILGFTLNNNGGRLTSFVNLNISKRNNFEQIKTHRLLSPDTLLSQDAYTTYPNTAYYVGYGFGYELNKKWNFNYDGRVSLNDFDNRTNNNSVIKKISTGQLFTDNDTRVRNDGSALSLSQSFNAKNNLDSMGSEWTTDLSYNYSRNNTDQFFSTAYRIPAIATTSGNGNSLNNRHYITAQTDLSKKFPRSFTVETGLKTSLQIYNSKTNYFRATSSSSEKDPSRTNTFDYQENINSFYLQASKGFADFLLKAGARLENTNMDGHQLIPDDTSFTVHRTDLFPYIYLSRKVVTIAGFDLRAYLVYRKSIARPVYEQLNPFPRYVDNYISEVGNPALKPQFTENYEFNISVDDTPLLAVGVNDTKNIFTNVIYPSDTSSAHAFRTYDNLGKNREFYIRGLGAIPPGHTYFFVFGGQYNHNFYQGIYDGQPLAFKKGTWTFFTYHTLKLGKLSLFTLNGFIRLRGQQQFYELGNFGSLNASINRRFMQQKLIVTLSVNDMFRTNQNDFVINQGGLNASGFRKADTRRFGINLRYNFGVRKKEERQNMFNVEQPN